MNKVLVGFLGFLFFSGQALAEDRALIVGIESYSDPRDDLPGVLKDVLSARGILKKLGFKDTQIKVLQDSQATRNAITSALGDWLTQGVKATDRVVFYYAGHGSQVPDDSGDEDDGCDEGINAYDGFIRDDVLEAAMDRVPANETLAMFNSCFSGTVTRGPTTQSSRFRMSRTICNEPTNLETW